MLITNHDDWPVPEIIAGYRSQSEAEFSFRQMKDPHVVSFSPMHHWTEHNIRVHVFTCVLALQIAHLMRRTAAQAGLYLSVRRLLAQLAGIGETVLIYPSTGGRPKARRMTTELTATSANSTKSSTWQVGTPKLGHTPKRATETHLTSKNSQPASRSSETPASRVQAGRPGAGAGPGPAAATSSPSRSWPGPNSSWRPIPR